MRAVGVKKELHHSQGQRFRRGLKVVRGQNQSRWTRGEPFLYTQLRPEIEDRCAKEGLNTCASRQLRPQAMWRGNELRCAPLVCWVFFRVYSCLNLLTLCFFCLTFMLFCSHAFVLYISTISSVSFFFFSCVLLIGIVFLLFLFTFIWFIFRHISEG